MAGASGRDLGTERLDCHRPHSWPHDGGACRVVERLGTCERDLVVRVETQVHFFACLPHRALGLAALDAGDAQVAARDCLRLWDEFTVANPAANGSDRQGQNVGCHHPLAISLLVTLRPMLEAVAAGDPVSSHPDLAAIVLPWRFLSVLERSIEAKRSMAKKNRRTAQNLLQQLRALLCG